MAAPQAFAIHVEPAVLDDLKRRLAATRWPDQVDGAGWDYGTNLDYLKDLVATWTGGYDWSARQAHLNAFPQFRTPIAGCQVHFVHVRGTGPDPLPLILTHGWPSTFAEYLGIVGALADPASYGDDPADSFDVVIPSLPGFGFSTRPSAPGPIAVDRLWRALMVDVLGYRRFGAYGGDIGARVTSALGRFHGDVVAAIQLGSVDLDWPDPLPGPSELSPAEQDYLDRVRAWEREEGAYAEVQGTRPQTLAYGLNDSPAGLAAWIIEKYRAWSDCGGDVESRFSRDDLLTTITLYWVTQTTNSSFRRYFDQRHGPRLVPEGSTGRIQTPTGIAMFPGEKDLIVPRLFAERVYNIQRWREMPSGGHFPAQEEPELLVEEIRAFFRQFRG